MNIDLNEHLGQLKQRIAELEDFIRWLADKDDDQWMPRAKELLEKGKK